MLRQTGLRQVGGILLGGILWSAACGSEPPHSNPLPRSAGPEISPADPPATASAGAAKLDGASGQRLRVVVLGDSLTAGLGLSPEEAFPSRLQERFVVEGRAFEIVNAGWSGVTTAGGSRRFAFVLDENVRVVIVALGGNDGLRGLPVDQMKRNLESIIDQATSHGANVLLAGMEAPPNFGADYTRAFREVFRAIADERDEVVFVPFLLEGVAGHPHLNQADGIHPNAEGATRIADYLWPVLRSMLPEAARTP
jgi:acyl-CoA thioesterase-1